MAGIANGAIGMVFMAIEVFPSDGPASDLSAFAMTFAMVAAGLIITRVVADAALGVLAFRFVRRRWRVVSARSN